MEGVLSIKRMLFLRRVREMLLRRCIGGFVRRTYLAGIQEWWRVTSIKHTR